MNIVCKKIKKIASKIKIKIVCKKDNKIVCINNKLN